MPRPAAIEVLTHRNVMLLIVAQVVFVTGAALLVTIGGIVGSELAPAPALATLPVAVMVLGTACATIPASLSMQRFGRRAGFCSAAIVAVLGALLGAHAVATSHFALFCIASAILGGAFAFAQQFRFAAAESVPINRVDTAVAMILLGSVGGAWLGPALAANGATLVSGQPFQGALYGLAALYGVIALVLLALRDNVPSLHSNPDEQPARPLAEVVRQPLFIVAVAGGVIGQGVMAYVMTATPVSMHVLGPHDLEATADVIRAHIMAMYLPSLVSGWLIARCGHLPVMAAGTFALLGAVSVGLSGQHLSHYGLALVLLGVGWNLMYVGGTALLVHTYRPAERFRAQAVNEFSVFGVSALVSLLAGSLLYLIGWGALLLSAVPFLALMLVALAAVRKRRPASA
jgi:MFS family permease